MEVVVVAEMRRIIQVCQRVVAEEHESVFRVTIFTLTVFVLLGCFFAMLVCAFLYGVCVCVCACVCVHVCVCVCVPTSCMC